MEENNLPLFANTCGKLFNDAIFFASTSKETVIPVTDLKKITFNKNITAGSLLFMALPFGLFAFPHFAGEGIFFNTLLYIVGFIMLVTAVFKAKMTYSLHLFMTDGTSRKIQVREGNKKDAARFATQAMKLIDAQKMRHTVQNALETQGIFRVVQ